MYCHLLASSCHSMVSCTCSAILPWLPLLSRHGNVEVAPYILQCIPCDFPQFAVVNEKNKNRSKMVVLFLYSMWSKMFFRSTVYFFGLTSDIHIFFFGLVYDFKNGFNNISQSSGAVVHYVSSLSVLFLSCSTRNDGN